MTLSREELCGPRIFASRYTPDMKPGEGEMINWRIGETVRICTGQDKGRLFVITSEGRSHNDAPGKFVREGYFVDDLTQTQWAKLEEALWFE